MSKKPMAEPRLGPPADTGPGVCAEAAPRLALFEPVLLLHSCLVSAQTPHSEPGRQSPRKVEGPVQAKTPARGSSSSTLLRPYTLSPGEVSLLQMRKMRLVLSARAHEAGRW